MAEPTSFAEALTQARAAFDRTFGVIREPEPLVRRTAEQWLAGLRYLGVEDRDIAAAMVHHAQTSYGDLIRMAQAVGGAENAHAVKVVRELASRGEADPLARYAREMVHQVLTRPH
jgi:hypothetical protein